ncbi:MAG: aldehyde dehydrogenase family protein [Planctomycetes bacterium]|nr:aldehyde dehydrogenase family protein [Planctomycetota bacterium]
MSNLDPDLRALQEVRDYVERSKKACEAVAHYSQSEIDNVCRAMAEAGAAAAYDLGRLAVEETGIGRVHYKVLKNLFGSLGIWESIKNEKSVGILSRDEKTGIVEVGTPSGIIAGIIPTTNPTSTALGKALISVKGRNSIVISPHPRAKRCIGETVEVMRRAIERVGAPPDLVLSLSNPTIESTGALMKHKKVAIILATGGSGLVEAAYSSGKPAYGVGPGNVPCFVDRSADVAQAARSVVTSQSFDNGTLCCSEQALVLDKPIAERFLAEMQKRGAYLCNAEETDKLAKYCNRRGHMNADVVGLDPWRIAENAGFRVPRETSVLLAHQGGVGPDWPLSIEILAPVLSVHVVDDWKHGCKVSMELLQYGGLGHTCAVHAKDERVLDAWFLEKPASRIIVNGPSSQGAVGYSTWLMPSMSLGCSPLAGNITSDNITFKHLLNVKRAAYPRKDWDAVERRDHERVAKFTRDLAPRGSGLAGDPAISGGTFSPDVRSALKSERVQSNWQGNPVPASSPKAAAAPSATGVPRSFTDTGSSSARVHAAPKSPAAPASSPIYTTSVSPIGGAAAAGGGASQVYSGSALSVPEIQSIMSHAGAGCPLGPCKGCGHQDVQTGACKA